MTLKSILLIAVVFVFTHLSAQDFTGLRSGNYSGVNGAFFNPANLADNRYSVDFNLISVGASLSNNQASFNIKKIGTSLNSDSIKNLIFGNEAGPSSGLINIDVHGPSVMFSVSPKMAFSLTTRLRVMGNVTDIDGKFAQKLTDDLSDDPEFPYTFASAENMRVNVHAWKEFGLGIGRVISDKGKHFFKAGVNLKYLSGTGNTFVNISKFNGTLDYDQVQDDDYLENASGQMGIGIGGINIDDFDAGDLTKMTSTGFGADIGFVYEFRPKYEEYKPDADNWQRDLNKYKFKVGVSVLDLGSIKYKKDPLRTGSYDIDIAGPEKFYLSELSDTKLEDLKSYFDNHPEYFNPQASNSDPSYKVSLPTTLNVDIDYHFNKGLYLNLAGVLAFRNKNDMIHNNYYYNSFIATPRYEGRKIGLYIPVSYNKLSGLNAGAAVRLGPLFFGSSSGFTALFGNSKKADVYFGLRFGSLYQSKLTKKQKREKETTQSAAN